MVDEIIQHIIDWIAVAPPLGVYLIFFGIAYIENIIPPMPGDVIVAFGGYLAAEGVISAGSLWGATVVASVIGFMNMYWFGHRWGARIEQHPKSHFVLRFIDYKHFATGKKWMGRWGQWVVFGNRFLAGTRSVISLTAGMSHLNIGLTILNSLLSSMLWNALLIGAGWLVKDNWKVIGKYLSNYGKVIIGLIAVVVIARLLFLYFRKKKAVSEDD